MFLIRMLNISVCVMLVKTIICGTGSRYSKTYFRKEENKHIIKNAYTELHVTRTKFECAAYCTHPIDCCRTSFMESNEECIVDSSIGCSAEVEVLASSIVLTKKLDCARGWEEVNGRCILYGSTPMTFTDAESFCTGQGGSLFTVKTAEENEWLRSTIQGYSFTWGPTLGAKRIASNTFVWLDEIGNYLPMSYENWREGEPNGVYTVNDCILFVKDSGYWDDIDCYDLEPVMCENSQQ